MIGSLGKVAFDTQHPNVRQIEPWQDGRQLATLLEAAFSQETIDASGHRMIDMLRNYGQFEPMTFGFGTSFLWIEDGQILGNASIQRNPIRRDTWIIGNVATDAAKRGRGIASAVMQACLRFAALKDARVLALQVDKGNSAAVRLYDRLGFQAVGEVTYYLRRSVRASPVPLTAELDATVRVRGARWSDREAVWQLARHNIPEPLTFSEPFERGVYRLGMRWSLFNTLNGNPEKWYLLENAASGAVLAAARTRVNIDGANHHIELMLRDDTEAVHGAALLEAAMQRFEPYISKPVYAAQSLPHLLSHEALKAVGFQAARHLVHMRMDL